MNEAKEENFTVRILCRTVRPRVLSQNSVSHGKAMRLGRYVFGSGEAPVKSCFSLCSLHYFKF